MQIEACLQGDLSLLDTQADTGFAKEHPLTLFGSTSDLSAIGLSLVVPYVSIDERFCVQEDRRLQVMLYLPSGSVGMQVAPVRCTLVDRKGPPNGYLLGARITEMADGERSRLITHLRTIG